MLPGSVTEVTFSEFEAAKQRYGLAFFFITRQPMDRIRDLEVWTHLLLLDAAKKEKITVSADDVKRVISSGVQDYILKDPAQYKKYVQDNFRCSAATLEMAMLELLTADRVRGLYRECFTVAPPATRKAAVDQAAGQSIEYAFGDYAALDASRFLDEAAAELKAEADPDAKLRDFFDKDPAVKLETEKFRHPRRFRLEMFYTIHSKLDDAALQRIEGLVKKAYPEAKFEEVNILDRRTYYGLYKNRLLEAAGSSVAKVEKDVREEGKPAEVPGKPDGEPKPGEQGGEKAQEPPKEPGKQDDPGAQAPPAKPGDDPAAPPGGAAPGQANPQNPAPPAQPDPAADAALREKMLKFGYEVTKDQVGREVALRSVYRFLHDQTKDTVSLKEIYDRLKAQDDPEHPICATEPGQGLIVFLDGSKGRTGEEIQEIEDSGVKFGFSFRVKVSNVSGPDLPKMNSNADTLGDEGHGRQMFRLLEIIPEQRKTFDDLTAGDKEDLKGLYYLPTRARERTKERLTALRQKFVDGTLKPEQFRAEAEALGCRVHEGEWIEATYDLQREPDGKQLWPDEYAHMRDRHFLPKSLAQVLDRDRVKQEWKAGSFLPVDVDLRGGHGEPGAAYLFRLRERKPADATTIPPSEISTWLKKYVGHRDSEEKARWTDPEGLRADFRMEFFKDMKTRIDEELKRREEDRKKGRG